MVKRFCQVSLVFFMLSFQVCFGQVPDLSGVWRLNVEKSTWGAMRKPASVTLDVQHREPALEYTGTVLYANEDSRDFVFKGAIDGKPHPMTRSFGSGSITIQRVNTHTFDSVFQTDNGNYVENSRTTLSSDGKSIRRVLTVKTPAGEQRWTEVYERR